MDTQTDNDGLYPEIQRAMENREIKAYYQPQYDAITCKLTSAEALTRWVKPDGTVVMPGSFVPALEQSAAVCRLDWYMIEEVCSALKRQKEAGIPVVPVAVNFSRKHLDEENFTEKLCGIVDRYGIAHKLIEVELTESAFADCTNGIESFINSIRAQGFRVAIDDFGSGLSCLSMVKDVAVDVLKLDRSLLSRNCEDEKERIVLESIMNFAHRLHLITIAEGVETQEQLGFLKTSGCKLIQGFLFARPMPEPDFWQACRKDTQREETEDILITQQTYGATQMLMEAVFMRYPLIIFANLTRNSYYMMAYENFSETACPSTGVFEELIRHGADTMHPEDTELFRETFCCENQLRVYGQGEHSLILVTRQIGNDGIYRKVETANYFVKNPSSDDVLVISLCHNLAE